MYILTIQFDNKHQPTQEQPMCKYHNYINVLNKHAYTLVWILPFPFFEYLECHHHHVYPEMQYQCTCPYWSWQDNRQTEMEHQTADVFL